VSALLPQRQVLIGQATSGTPVPEV